MRLLAVFIVLWDASVLPFKQRFDVAACLRVLEIEIGTLHPPRGQHAVDMGDLLNRQMGILCQAPLEAAIAVGAQFGQPAPPLAPTQVLAPDNAHVVELKALSRRMQPLFTPRLTTSGT